MKLTVVMANKIVVLIVGILAICCFASVVNVAQGTATVCTPPYVPSNGNCDLISFTVESNFKLTGSNYPAWCAHLSALLKGYNLMGYVDGSLSCPSETDQSCNLWVRQDSMLLHTLLTSVDATIANMLGSVTSSQQAWASLARMYANKSPSHLMSLKEQLMSITKGDSSIQDYLSRIKRIADELEIIGGKVADTDLVIYTLRGLPSDYHEVSAAIRARETPITFADLFNKLTDHESILLRQSQIADSTPLHTASSSCFGNVNKGVMIAAASAAVFENRKACGRRYRVKCTNATPNPCKGGSVDVTVVDYCPPGCAATIDLSQDAFAIIANPNACKIRIE